MGLRDDLRKTPIRPPVTIRGTASVRDAVWAMRSAGLGCLNESVKVLDDRVANQMVSRLPWVSPTESLNVVLESMEENNMRFLAVLDDKHRVIGITGQKTLMEFPGDYFPQKILTQDPTGESFSRRKEGA